MSTEASIPLNHHYQSKLCSQIQVRCHVPGQEGKKKSWNKEAGQDNYILKNIFLAFRHYVRAEIPVVLSVQNGLCSLDVS